MMQFLLIKKLKIIFPYLLTFVLFYDNVQAQTFTTVPNPIGFTDDRKGLDNDQTPVEYNGRLYFRYEADDGEYHLASWDGVSLNIIQNHSKYDDASRGFYGGLFVYNGNLYGSFRRNFSNGGSTKGNFSLMRYTGNGITGGDSNFTIINPSSAYRGNGDGYCYNFFGYGVTEPIEYDGKYYLGYRRDDGVEVLMEFNGSSLTPHLPPADYDGDTGYWENPIVYNGKLYLQYKRDYDWPINEFYTLMEFDGSTLTPIESPSSWATYDCPPHSPYKMSSAGYQGKPYIFDGKLFLQYYYGGVGTPPCLGSSDPHSATYNLAYYDGTNLVKVENPSNANIGTGRGYVGNPIEFDGDLYIAMRGNDGLYMLAKYDKITETITTITPPSDYDDGSNPFTGYFGDAPPIEYNGNLYLQFWDESDNKDLLVYDGSALTNIPLPADFEGGTNGPGYEDDPIVYHGKLYINCERSNSASTNPSSYSLVSYDSSTGVVTEHVSPSSYTASSAGYSVFDGMAFIWGGRLHMRYQKDPVSEPYGSQELMIFTAPPGISLPIELLNFNAKRLNEKQVQLNWATTQEKSNQGFEVEMSRDAQHFEKLGFIEGQGNSLEVMTYEFIVNNSGSAYYRLKQVDFDGNFNYSELRFVEGGELSDYSLNLYPNPTKSKIHLNLKDYDNSYIDLQLVNMQGEKILNIYDNLINAENTLNQTIPKLSKGVYILNVVYKGYHQQKKLVIQ